MLSKLEAKKKFSRSCVRSIMYNFVQCTCSWKRHCRFFKRQKFNFRYRLPFFYCNPRCSNGVWSKFFQLCILIFILVYSYSFKFNKSAQQNIFYSYRNSNMHLIYFATIPFMNTENFCHMSSVFLESFIKPICQCK